MSVSAVSDIINAWIETALQLPFTIENDVISKPEGDAACLRYDPAPAAEKRYINGERLLKWNLTYYIRCKNRATARGYAYDITARLDDETIIDNTSGLKIDIEAETLPQFIGVDDKGQNTYAAAITCTYLEPKENEANERPSQEIENSTVH